MTIPPNGDTNKINGAPSRHVGGAGNLAAWPIAAMQDAFLDALPKLTREKVDHPNDLDSPNLRSLNDGDAFARAMLAALLAFNAQPTDGAGLTLEEELASALKASVDRLQLLIDADRHKLLDVVARDAGRLALARHAAQSVVQTA